MKAASLITIKKQRFDILKRFSENEKLQRVIAYWLRFKDNSFGTKKSGPLTPDDLQHAETNILKMVQREAFPHELQIFEKGHLLQENNKLAPLSPFLDKTGVTKVGGRLFRADISETQKHPTILPAKHHITTLLMKKEHLRLRHCGSEQLLYVVRQKYWPLSGR